MPCATALCWTLDSHTEKGLLRQQCHLVCENLVKLRGKSSDLLLKNIFGNKFSIKLSK